MEKYIGEGRTLLGLAVQEAFMIAQSGSRLATSWIWCSTGQGCGRLGTRTTRVSFSSTKCNLRVANSAAGHAKAWLLQSSLLAMQAVMGKSVGSAWAWRACGGELPDTDST